MISSAAFAGEADCKEEEESGGVTLAGSPLGVDCQRLWAASATDGISSDCFEPSYQWPGGGSAGLSTLFLSTDD